jgi:hypothetical protein
MKEKARVTLQVGFQIPESDYFRVVEYQKQKKLSSASAAMRALIQEALDVRGIAGIDPDDVIPVRTGRKRDIAIQKDWAEVSIPEAVAALSIESAGMSDRMMVGKLLKSIGYLRFQKRTGKSRQWIFRRPVAAVATPPPVEITEADADEWTRNLGLDSMTRLKEALEHDAAVLARKGNGGE